MGSSSWRGRRLPGGVGTEDQKPCQVYIVRGCKLGWGRGQSIYWGWGQAFGVNPSLGLMAGNHGEPWESRLWHSSGCQISGVKALWMERRLVWEVGWGVSCLLPAQPAHPAKCSAAIQLSRASRPQETPGLHKKSMGWGRGRWALPPPQFPLSPGIRSGV